MGDPIFRYLKNWCFFCKVESLVTRFRSLDSPRSIKKSCVKAGNFSQNHPKIDTSKNASKNPKNTPQLSRIHPSNQWEQFKFKWLLQLRRIVVELGGARNTGLHICANEKSLGAWDTSTLINFEENL